MHPFFPAHLFDLSNFIHASIFDSCEFAWQAIPLIENYLSYQKLGGIECEIPDGVHLVNKDKISIGKNSVIEPGAYIKGPCVIGSNCTVRHGAYIRGGLITGNDCVIGHDSEIKNSIFLNHACAPHFAYVGDSILGNNVNLGAGTVCANLKLDRKEVAIFWGGQRFNTGLKKFGVILGDGVQTGCHSVLNPGTLMGKGSWCYPCLNFGGVIPPHHVVKSDVAITAKPIKS